MNLKCRIDQRFRLFWNVPVDLIHPDLQNLDHAFRRGQDLLYVAQPREGSPHLYGQPLQDGFL